MAVDFFLKNVCQKNNFHMKQDNAIVFSMKYSESSENLLLNSYHFYKIQRLFYCFVTVCRNLMKNVYQKNRFFSIFSKTIRNFSISFSNYCE